MVLKHIYHIHTHLDWIWQMGHQHEACIMYFYIQYCVTTHISHNYHTILNFKNIVRIIIPLTCQLFTSQIGVKLNVSSLLREQKVQYSIQWIGPWKSLKCWKTFFLTKYQSYKNRKSGKWNCSASSHTHMSMK